VCSNSNANINSEAIPQKYMPEKATMVKTKDTEEVPKKPESRM